MLGRAALARRPGPPRAGGARRRRPSARRCAPRPRGPRRGRRRARRAASGVSALADASASSVGEGRGRRGDALPGRVELGVGRATVGRPSCSRSAWRSDQAAASASAVRSTSPSIITLWIAARASRTSSMAAWSASATPAGTGGGPSCLAAHLQPGRLDLERLEVGQRGRVDLLGVADGLPGGLELAAQRRSRPCPSPASSASSRSASSMAAAAAERCSRTRSRSCWAARCSARRASRASRAASTAARCSGRPSWSCVGPLGPLAQGAHASRAGARAGGGRCRSRAWCGPRPRRAGNGCASRSSARSCANPSAASHRSSDRSRGEWPAAPMAPRSPASSSASRARSDAFARATVSRRCRPLGRVSWAGWFVTFVGPAASTPRHPSRRGRRSLLMGHIGRR